MTDEDRVLAFLVRSKRSFAFWRYPEEDTVHLHKYFAVHYDTRHAVGVGQQKGIASAVDEADGVVETAYIQSSR